MQYLKNRQGSAMVELCIVLMIAGLIMLSITTAGSRVKQTVQIATTQKAMIFLATENIHGLFPVDVELDDLRRYGASLDGWIVQNYKQTGNPKGVLYELTLETPKGERVCVEPSAFTDGNC